MGLLHRWKTIRRPHRILLPQKLFKTLGKISKFGFSLSSFSLLSNHFLPTAHANPANTHFPNKPKPAYMFSETTHIYIVIFYLYTLIYIYVVFLGRTYIYSYTHRSIANSEQSKACLACSFSSGGGSAFGDKRFWWKRSSRGCQHYSQPKVDELETLRFQQAQYGNPRCAFYYTREMKN